jgi:hypothetical protein
MQQRLVRVAPVSALAGRVAEAGAYWVLLSGVDSRGVQTDVACLTTADRIAADAPSVWAEGLDKAVAGPCTAWFRRRGHEPTP